MSTKQPASAHNAPTLDDEVTLALRAITEKRAATLGYLLDESRQRHQPDDYARDAIRHYGRDIGRSVRAKMRHGHDLQEFAAVFTRGLESRVYEMETVSASPSSLLCCSIIALTSIAGASRDAMPGRLRRCVISAWRGIMR